MAQTILRLEKVCYCYHSMQGEVQALTDISFSVKQGDFVAIVGPSGCGKSTLLSIIAGIIKPESGNVLFPMFTSDKTPKIGYMLQQDQLFEWKNVYKNILLGIEIGHQKSSAARLKAEQYMKEYGLWQFRNKKPSELSGGMKQRAALIRTLLLEPDLLLLDESFSSLDYQTRLSVSNDICKIIKSTKKTAILVTHDISEAISLANHIIILGKRPATVLSQVSVKLTLDSDDLLSARNAPEFSHYFNLIWKELEQNVTTAII